MDVMDLRRRIMLNEPHIVTPASVSLQNFKTDMIAPLKDCKVHFSPVQEGTGDPSPDNVRAITGWIGLTTYYSGENLYIPNINNKGYINASGIIKVDTTGTYTDLIPVTAGETYSFKCTTARINQQSTNRRLHGYDSDGNWIRQIAFKTTDTATVEDVSLVETIPSDISYIRVSFRNQDTNVRVAKENVVSVNWSTEAGTVYGGYVNLITGEIWQTHRQAPIVRNENDTYWNTWGTSLMYNSTTMGSTNGKRKVGTIVLSDALIPIGGTVNPQNVTTLDEIRYYGVHASYPQYLFMANPNGLSSAEWRKWLYDTYPDANICYELEMPILLTTLTPTQLKTFRGTNNVWSNANGNIDISYWVH